MLQGHHRHSSNQHRSSSHQRSSNSSSSSASAATRNNNFESGFYRGKNNSPNHQSKSASMASKKKSGGTSAGQNHPYTAKFGHPHGNATANLRVPPPASNKMPATQMNVNGGGISNDNNGANHNSTKGKMTSMKASPSHYVVVQRHGQNITDHRHHTKQSPK